jgi:O-antigen/teichoic acid export membrane protein
MRLNFNRRTLLYAPLLAIASALLFARTLFYARIFPVEGFGLFSQALLVANTFTTFAGLGLTLLAQKLLPQYHARGQREAFDDLVSACIAMCVASVALTAVSLLVAFALGWLRSWMTFGAALVYAVTQYLFVLRLIELKSELRFLGHARLSGIRAVALIAAGPVVATWTRDVTATILAEALVTLAVTGPSLFGERGRKLFRRAVGIRHEFRRLTQFYPAAARLLWLNGTTVILYAIDRWFGIAFLSKRDYGIFALGLTVVLLFETAQAIVNVSAFPLMGRMLAGGDHRRAFRFARLATLVVLVTAALCYVPFILLLDFLLRTYLPTYLEAQLVIKLAVIAGVFRLGDFFASFAILLDHERELSVGSGTLLAAAVLGLMFAGSAGVGFDPDRMMTVTVVIAICAFVVNLAIAMRAYRSSMLRREGAQAS